MRPERDGMENLPAVLDLAAFEQTPGGLFRPAGTLPDWFNLQGDDPAEIDLAKRFPLLELFLADCALALETGTPRRLDSDVWEEDDPPGGKRYMQATALRLGTLKMVLLRRLPPERFTYQQLYHDYQLAEEQMSRLREVAERATRAKSEFLAVMSHEIRTPLNALIGMAEILSSTPLTPEQEKCVGILQRSSEGLLNLINDILDLSKVESGKIDLERVLLDPRDVVSRALEMVASRAESKGLELRQSISPEIPSDLIGDPKRLQQIVVNLLGNAIKFTSRGHVEIRVEPNPDDPRPGSLRFAISDTGIGIQEDKLHVIFESFTQADSSTTRRYGGTGLGLSICRQLVELMGGRIWVESQSGQGSTFFFTVTRSAAEDRPLSRSEGQQVSSKNLQRRLNGLRILLADDSEDNQYMITSYLDSWKCVVEFAANGQEAIDKFLTRPFDVILMDVEMPVMDGYTAARQIRHYELENGLPAIPVVALTAHAFADVAEKVREIGFTAHLSKPLRRVTLVQALATYCRLGAPASESSGAPAARQSDLAGPGDERMVDAAAAYLTKRRQDVQAYRQALANRDFETISMLAHKMKGTGTAYGFPGLTEIGAAIEQGALRGDSGAIAASVDRLAAYDAAAHRSAFGQ